MTTNSCLRLISLERPKHPLGALSMALAATESVSCVLSRSRGRSLCAPRAAQEPKAPDLVRFDVDSRTPT